MANGWLINANVEGHVIAPHAHHRRRWRSESYRFVGPQHGHEPRYDEGAEGAFGFANSW